MCGEEHDNEHHQECVKLGLAYDKDGFAGTDYAKAVSYYREAYENGSEDGACCLACMYENGWGVEQNSGKLAPFWGNSFDNAPLLYDFIIPTNPRKMPAITIITWLPA